VDPVRVLANMAAGVAIVSAGILWVRATLDQMGLDDDNVSRGWTIATVGVLVGALLAAVSVP